MNEEYRQPTLTLDSDHPTVIAFAQNAIGDASTEIDKAVKLYYAVRDGIRYNPYTFSRDPDTFKASYTIAKGEHFCVPKAILLAAAGRAVGLTTRLGFVDVKNHLASKKLLERLGTDLFVFHGNCEFLLEGKWVKTTPAFHKSLCETFNVAPLEFDGRSDALFQSFNNDGNRYMEYVKDRGTFADLPLEMMIQAFKDEYDTKLEPMENISGDMEQEGRAERKT